LIEGEERRDERGVNTGYKMQDTRFKTQDAREN